MRLISLNTWGGRMFEPLMKFIEAEAPATDIFCFQELYFEKEPHENTFGIHADLAEEIRKILPGYAMFGRFATDGAYGYRAPYEKIIGDRVIRMGEAIFVKNGIEVVRSGGFHTYVPDSESDTEKIEPATGNFLFVEIEAHDEQYAIGNVHGIWLPGSKSDFPKRLEQSEHLESWVREYREKTILCGDFNLQPLTKSIEIIDADMRDLIKEFKIDCTRSRFYTDMEKYADYIADYAFVSHDVRVDTFKVLPDEVSDHLPLFLEFS